MWNNERLKKEKLTKYRSIFSVWVHISLDNVWKCVNCIIRNFRQMLRLTCTTDLSRDKLSMLAIHLKQKAKSSVRDGNDKVGRAKILRYRYHFNVNDGVRKHFIYLCSLEWQWILQTLILLKLRCKAVIISDAQMSSFFVMLMKMAHKKIKISRFCTKSIRF